MRILLKLSGEALSGAAGTALFAVFLALTLFGWPAWWRNAKYRRAANGSSALWTYQLKGNYR